MARRREHYQCRPCAGHCSGCWWCSSSASWGCTCSAGRESTTQAGASAESGLRDRERRLILSGEGFDYEITLENEKIARIRAERILSETEEEVTLEGVGPIQIYRADGNHIFIESDRAIYNFETQDASLEGNVRISGANGAELRTSDLDMAYKRRRVRSRSEVEFELEGKLRGRANRLQASLANDFYRFSGNVQVVTEPVEGKRRSSTAATSPTAATPGWSAPRETSA